MNSETVDTILRFWFAELREEQWFKVDPAVDQLIRDRFLSTYETVAAKSHDDTGEVPTLALATVIVLDQFPRNMFRGTPRAFATDAAALQIAKTAVDLGIDVLLTPTERQFLYLPYQHSEDLDTQAESVALYEKIGEDHGLDYARRHKVIVDRFSRFPHRNAILGRASTPEELAFLTEPGSSF
jgi:uncharacterized protein (DUF924 family)